MTATARAQGWLVRAAVLGVVAGFLGGLFGVGGGILIVPALVLVLHMDQRLAHGTSLAAVLPIAVASLTGYTLEDKVDWPVGALPRSARSAAQSSARTSSTVCPTRARRSRSRSCWCPPPCASCSITPAPAAARPDVGRGARC